MNLSFFPRARDPESSGVSECLTATPQRIGVTDFNCAPSCSPNCSPSAEESLVIHGLRLAADSATDGVAILGPDECYRFVNTAYARIHGAPTVDSLLGRSWGDLHEAEADSSIGLAAAASLAGGSAWDGGCTGRRLDGVPFPQELSLVAISGGGYICIVRDLTDQGSAQVALTAALQHQTALLNNIPDQAWIKDTQSRFVAVNDALVAAYGVPGYTLIGQTDRAFFPAEIAERFLADDDRVMRSGERITTEYSVPWQAGAMWIETTKTAVLDADGQVIGTVGIARDITARRRADYALRASEAQLRAVVDRSAISIVVTDPAGVIVSANPAYQRMVGYSAVELEGRRAMDFAAPEDRELAMKAASEIRAGVKDMITIEQRHVRKEGGTVWTSVTLSSIEAGTDGPRITGIVAMVQDISERKALEATLLHRASHDELTSLPNRTYFRERVERALARPARSRDRVAVLFVDLDDFKAV
ncbi:MAG: PAS domain S-box protein, partial [Gemmatimonadaceae bacterium]